ncbi:hypothetical protein D3C81_1494270 [compost metagenome]
MCDLLRSHCGRRLPEDQLHGLVNAPLRRHLPERVDHAAEQTAGNVRHGLAEGLAIQGHGFKRATNAGLDAPEGATEQRLCLAGDIGRARLEVGQGRVPSIERAGDRRVVLGEPRLQRLQALGQILLLQIDLRLQVLPLLLRSSVGQFGAQLQDAFVGLLFQLHALLHALRLLIPHAHAGGRDAVLASLGG